MAYVEALAQHVVGRRSGNVEAILGEIMAHGRWRHTYRLTTAMLGSIEVLGSMGQGAEAAGQHVLLAVASGRHLISSASGEGTRQALPTYARGCSERPMPSST